MGYPTSNKPRPLHINFDVYSEGEDNEFKYELVSLMKGSILELQLAAANAVTLQNPDIFKKAAHKAKSTLVLLNDNELVEGVENFKKELLNQDSRSGKELDLSKIDKLNELCDSIVESLEKEAEQLRSS